MSLCDIDAELVLPDSRGRPDFYGLHRGWRSAGAQLAVFAFDLLYRDGKDLRALPLVERKGVDPVGLALMVGAILALAGLILLVSACGGRT